MLAPYAWYPPKFNVVFDGFKSGCDDFKERFTPGLEDALAAAATRGKESMGQEAKASIDAHATEFGNAIRTIVNEALEEYKETAHEECAWRHEELSLVLEEQAMGEEELSSWIKETVVAFAKPAASDIIDATFHSFMHADCEDEGTSSTISSENPVHKTMIDAFENAARTATTDAMTTMLHGEQVHAFGFDELSHNASRLTPYTDAVAYLAGEAWAIMEWESKRKSCFFYALFLACCYRPQYIPAWCHVLILTASFLGYINKSQQDNEEQRAQHEAERTKQWKSATGWIVDSLSHACLSGDDVVWLQGVQNRIGEGADMLERLSKLFRWVDPEQSKWMTLGVLCSLVIHFLLPFTLIVFCAGTAFIFFRHTKARVHRAANRLYGCISQYAYRLRGNKND